MQALDSDYATLTRLHTRRLRDQIELIEKGHDLSRLRRAVSTFSSLQEIKLLRLQDEADEFLIRFIHNRSLGASL